MAGQNVLWKVLQNGTYVDMPVPSDYQVSWEDLDDDSYRSKLTGNLVRRRISPRWIKLSMSYNFLTDEQLNTLARAINTDAKYTVRMFAPPFGNLSYNGHTNQWVQFVAYTSRFEAELLPLQSGWRVSFSVIQATKGTFQN